MLVPVRCRVWKSRANAWVPAVKSLPPAIPRRAASTAEPSRDANRFPVSADRTRPRKNPASCRGAISGSRIGWSRSLPTTWKIMRRIARASFSASVKKLISSPDRGSTPGFDSAARSARRLGPCRCFEFSPPIPLAGICSCYVLRPGAMQPLPPPWRSWGAWRRRHSLACSERINPRDIAGLPSSARFEIPFQSAGGPHPSFGGSTKQRQQSAINAPAECSAQSVCVTVAAEKASSATSIASLETSRCVTSRRVDAPNTPTRTPY